MKLKYALRGEKDDLSLYVTIGTPGTAYSLAYKYLDDKRDALVAESDVDSANIVNAEIGKGKEYINSYLKVVSVIDFGALDSSLWEQLGENIIAEVKLDGGLDGNQPFPYELERKTVTPNKRIVIIEWEIQFIL